MPIRTKNFSISMWFALISLFVFGATAVVFAEGDETLGEPTIPIAEGTGFAIAGTGLEPQPGSFDLEVPDGVAITQVLLYWSGASVDGAGGDDSITINGVDVVGAHIGTGPGRKTYESYRADITDLGLVSPGMNSFTVENMNFNEENDGAGIIVIYDDGTRLSTIAMRDGLDIAYIHRPEPGMTTVPQTFTFEAQDVDRTAELGFFVGSVLPNRPNVIRTTIDGVATDHFNLLSSAQGDQWDAIKVPVEIPAGATELTVEVQSESDGTDRTPASLTWVNVTLMVPSVSVTGCNDFSFLSPGTNVEGFGVVHPLLEISSSGNVIAIAEGEAPTAYVSGTDRTVNGSLGPTAGMYDSARNHDYTFTFDPNLEVGYFTMRMVDWGDFNPNRATLHQATLTAYDVDGNVVDTHQLSFTSNGAVLPVSDEYGMLSVTGDAGTAQPGEPGNFVFTVVDLDKRINRVELAFATDLPDVKSADPAFALKDICFGDPPAPSVCTDFAAQAPGSSVEGLGTVGEHLDISTTNGRSVVIAEGVTPYAYVANAGNLLNGALGTLGGITDLSRMHDYTFSFAPDVTASYFSVNLVDYGDWNPDGATLHQAQFMAYDQAGAPVATEMLRFTSDGSSIPVSDEYGNLLVSGDAAVAMPAQPGNFTFSVSDLGAQISRVELRFSSDISPNMPTDPFLALKNICYTAVTP